MKTTLKLILLFAITLTVMSFVNANLSKNREEKEVTRPLMNEVPDEDCYWQETFLNNLRTKRDAACGSRSSLKVWFTNPYNVRVRVAFYLRDEYGKFNQYSPYTASVNPGKTIYHHKCKSNGQYIILASVSGSGCKFPDLE